MSAATDDLTRWAVFSDDGTYRYKLGRRWSPDDLAGFIMLNPSTADATDDDPTIRRCVGFARSWGYGGILVGNVYAYRATDPRELRGLGARAEGPRNDQALNDIAHDAGLIVCAWGAQPGVRPARVLGILGRAGVTPMCLGRTRGGQPRHPLYLAAATPLESYT